MKLSQGCVPQGGFGSLVAVSILGCEIACEAAVGCDAFSYNAVQQQCFLKNGASKTTCPVSGYFHTLILQESRESDHLLLHVKPAVLSSEEHVSASLSVVAGLWGPIPIILPFCILTKIFFSYKQDS